MVSWTGRLVVFLGMVGLMAACGPAVTKDPDPQPEPKPIVTGHPNFPEGWQGWPQFPSSPKARAESSQYLELYYNETARQAGASGRFPTGTVLVKAQHALVGGRKGRLTSLAVMRKDVGGDYGGWQFEVYDPKTKKKITNDADVCAICHTQRSSVDFVFSDRSSW